MAISRFDRPAEAQFMNTYVPIPFEQIAQAAMVRQQKHETGLATEQELLTSLGDIKALDELKDPFTGESIATGDKQRAEAFVQSIESDIENLSRVTPDRSSPEWMQLASGVISKVRKARGSTGVIGRIENRYNTIQQMQQDIRESGASRHRLLGIHSDLSDFLASTEGGTREGTLTYTGTVAPEIDRVDKLYKSMDKLSPSTLIEYARASGDPNLAGMTETKLAEGIPYNLAYNVAMRNIGSDKDIQRDMYMEAEDMTRRGEAESVEAAYEELVTDLADTAARTYQEYNVEKLQLGRLPDEDASGSRRTNIPIGHDFSKETTVTYRPEALDPDKMERNIVDLQAQNEAMQRTDTYLRDKYFIDEFKQGWPKDAQGNKITENEDGTPVTPINLSRQLSSIEQGILGNKSTIAKYENLDRRIKESIDPNLGRDELTKEAREFYDGIQKGIHPFDIPSTEGMFRANALATAEDIRGLMASAKQMDKDDFVDLVMQDREAYLPGTKAYGDKYKEFYEQMSEPYTLDVIEYQISPKFAEAHPFIGSLATSAGSFETADVDVKDMATGMSLSEMGKGKYEEYDFSKSKAKSYFFDKESKTKVSVIYNVPPNKNVVGTGGQEGVFRAPAPREFHAVLFEQGTDPQKIEMLIKEQLNDTVYNSKDKVGTTGDAIGLTTGIDNEGNIKRGVLKFDIEAPISPREAGATRPSGEPITALHFTATATFPDGTKRDLIGVTESDLVEQMYSMWENAQRQAMQNIAESMKGKRTTGSDYGAGSFLNFDFK